MTNVNLDKLAGALRRASDALRDAAGALNGARESSDGNGGAAPRTDLLTGRQLGAIHGMARRAGLSRDKLADLVNEIAGTRDLTRLSRTEASEVIDRLNATIH